MAVLFKNNAATTLASGITNVATSITVATGAGSLFPAITAPDFFYATLIDSSNNIEIVKVTARTTDTMTVTRAQEGTTARAYATGDKFELRVTAAGLDNKLDKDTGGTISGAVALNGAVTIGAGGSLTNNSSNTITSGAGFTLGNSHLIYSAGAGEVAIRIGATGPFYGIGTTASNNLRINNASNGDILLAMGGTTYVTVQNTTGNVGIGGTPSGKLDVVGSGGTVSVNTAGDQVSFSNNGVNSVTASGAAATLRLQATGASGVVTITTAGSERFRVTSTGAITSSDLADAVGYKGIPQNSQSAAYTLALSDMGKHVSISTGGVTIPANGSVAFPVGATVVVYNNSASNQTIAITTDTLYLAGTATTGTRTLAQRGVATLIKVASTTWVVSGNVT